MRQCDWLSEIGAKSSFCLTELVSQLIELEAGKWEREKDNVNK